MAGCCERCNEPLSFMKCSEGFLQRIVWLVVLLDGWLNG